MFTKEKAKSRALRPCPSNSNRTINMDHINVWHGVLTFTATTTYQIELKHRLFNRNYNSPVTKKYFLSFFFTKKKL